MTALELGTAVTWRWGAYTVEGKIERVYTRTVSRTIKGKRIRRNASKEHPAYLIRQDDGGRALKSESEVEKAHERRYRSRPAANAGGERRNGPAPAA